MTRDEICNGLQEMLGEAYSRWVNYQYTRDALIIGIGTYVGKAIKLLKKQPDIVRCKDCKYWGKENGLTARKCSQQGIITGQFDFCSYGRNGET
jgi:hypothetical protein